MRNSVRRLTVAMGVLLTAAACDRSPTALPAAVPHATRQNIIGGEGDNPCPAGWTMHWDGHCVPIGGGGGTGGGGGVPAPTPGEGGSGGGGTGEGIPPSGPPAPAGFEQSEWDKLSPAEKDLVLYDDFPKWVNRKEEMKAIAKSAIDESLRLTGAAKDDDGTRQNAIQHALWAGKMATAYGYMDALKWTTAHEERPVPFGVSLELFNQHKKMDLSNNALGLGYFWYPFGTIEEYVMKNQGQLCWIEGPGGRICF